jgi:hypothetical protein
MAIAPGDKRGNGTRKKASTRKFPAMIASASEMSQMFAANDIGSPGHIEWKITDPHATFAIN